MNILLINHYAGSPTHGMEYRPYYFAREWVRSGHQVTIVAATESHVRNVSPQTEGEVTEESIDGIRYVWLATPGYHGNGPDRVKNIFAFLYRLSRTWPRVVGSNPPDIVIASSTYPLDIYPARRIARRFHARLVFEVHDLWPLTPIEVGGMSRRHPFVMLLQRAEDTAYRDCDRVVSLLPRTLDYMVSRGLRADKWRCVSNGIDSAECDAGLLDLPEEHRRAIAAARSRGSFLVGYAGGHNVSNGLDTLVEAAQRLVERPVEFVLVGKGTERERLKVNAGGAKMHFLRPIPRPLVPALLAEMDALYLGFRDEPLYRFGVCPNKLMDYMMAAKPIIYAINGHDDTVEGARCGMTLPAERPDLLAEAIVEMSGLAAEERQAMGCRGRDYVLKNHDYAVLAQKFLEDVC